MGTAVGQDLHINKVITQMAIGYRPRGAIADQIFPVVTVAKQSDLYNIWSRQEALTVEETSRAPGTYARSITRSVSSASYYAKNYALATPITDEDLANMDESYYMQLVNGRVQYLTGKLLLDWDQRVSLAVNSTANVGSSATVSSAWNGAGTADTPLNSVNAAIDNVLYRTGYRPNRIVFGARAWDSFRRAANVRNLIYGVNNGGGYVSRQQVAALFEVDQILVGESFFSNANEAQAEAVTPVWAHNALVYYAPPTPTIEDPSFAYSLRWQRPGLANMQGELHARNSETKSEKAEVGYYQDEKITAPEYGFLIVAVNSSQ